ncbi:uncharacterized protein C16orf96 homolog [Sphaerodactylus townsendi]|uniref:uncharacterized protein C16orf96 homolog n=1 Tax=Sphaerodactylus townsendi TaxID=933632 RepID=UPI002026E1E5|nr:uncharacterized protein C16orf96 homolog [Sphaerodactylus townsendi]
MSQRVTFGELVNLAIGTPELGNVNFNALHFLLHSMLQHFNLQDVQKEVSEEELEFIKPPPRSSVPKSPSQTDTSLRRTSSIFHQMHERIISIEKQLLFLNDTPTTTELLSRTEAGTFAQPAQDMWQLMQLKKKMEINEEGMTKAMNTLQDLLSNICALKVSTENFKQELENMKGTFEKLDIDKMLQQLGQMDGQAKVIQELQQQLNSMKAKTSSMPVLSDLVQWGTLCERLQGKSFPAMEKEATDRLSKEMLASLGQLPEQHKELATRVTSLEKKLKCQAEQPKPSEIVGDDGMETTSLTSLTERVNSLESCDLQRKESLKGILDEIPKLKEQYEALERAVEKVKRNSSNIQNTYKICWNNWTSQKPTRPLSGRR